MNSAKIILGGTALFLGVFLVGCNSTPTKPVTPTSSVNKPSVLASAPAAKPSNPYLIKFDVLAAKLTPEQEAQLQRLVPELKESKSIVIRGYANKKEVGNAQAAALTRAGNVEKFLIKQGVPDKKMQLKFNTEDAQHAVEIDINS